MTVTTANIGWSSYSNFEGPFFIGKCPYVLPAAPTENDELMAVITAAEGDGNEPGGWNYDASCTRRLHENMRTFEDAKIIQEAWQKLIDELQRRVNDDE